MSKYDKLTDVLMERPEPTVTMTFDELHRVIGGLPASARTYSEWWTNRESSQPHSRGWLRAGRMASPDFDRNCAVFQADPEAQERLGSRPVSVGTRSASGVWIADDFRSNLIVDRYDPIFAAMRASKLKHLRSDNSEDAATWNAFRSLLHVDPERWLSELWERGLPTAVLPDDRRVVLRLWPEVEAPPALRALADEGATEADVLIESPSWVWFIEAKLGSDISPGTTTRPDRDQILRNIDVGSYYAGVRFFYFSLLILTPERTPKGVERLRRYQDQEVVRRALAGHRPDGLKNLGSVGLLTWQDIGDVLASVARSDGRDDERAFARRAADWLAERRLWGRDSEDTIATDFS